MIRRTHGGLRTFQCGAWLRVVDDRKYLSTFYVIAFVNINGDDISHHLGSELRAFGCTDRTNGLDHIGHDRARHGHEGEPAHGFWLCDCMLRLGAARGQPCRDKQHYENRHDSDGS